MHARTASITTVITPANTLEEERHVIHTPNETTEGAHTGTVVVTEFPRLRLKQIVIRTYLVEEQPEIGIKGRQFLVLDKRTNSANADMVMGQHESGGIGRKSECRVFGEFGTCTCDESVDSNAFAMCVHILTLSALVAAGLPHPQGHDFVLGDDEQAVNLPRTGRKNCTTDKPNLVDGTTD